MRVSPPLVVVAAAVSVGTVACGGSGYQYVQNDELGIYARLPDDWTVYDEADLFPSASERELAEREDQIWMRTFDAAADPSVEGSRMVGGDHPTGVFVVRGLTPQEREGLDLSTLRGAGNPGRDPIAADALDEEGAITVLTDEPIEFEGGYTGIHTVFTVEQGSTSVVMDQTAVRNAQTTAIAVFQVGCTETCYFETHKDEIADLVDSWTIQEVRR
jgi:hypothetical protein